MKEVKIAICLFGQIRTGLYCAPAIKAAHDLIDGKEIVIQINRSRREVCKIKIDYFCWAKDFDSNGMVSGKTFGELTNKLDESAINDVFSIYNPVKTGITTFDNDVKDNDIQSNIKWLMPKPLLLSIVSAINLKKEYELDCGLPYDFCFCQRFDSLTTPFNPVERIVREHGIRDNIIYSHWITNFPQEDNAWGVGDFWFGGDSFAMDLMSASLSQYIDSDLPDLDLNESQLGYGPNVILYNAIHQNNIWTTEFPGGLKAAPVRPESDLTLNALDPSTAVKHHSHFEASHPSSKTTKK
jgi:hypothetical protein